MKQKKSKAMRELEAIAGPLTFASMIRSLRLCDELSLAAFAEQLGVSRAYLCDVEQGRRRVSPARAAEWARVLGYSEPELDAAEIDLRVSVSAA